MPIHKDSTAYTAFRAAKGLFEWLRLAMGLKGAGSARRNGVFFAMKLLLVKKTPFLLASYFQTQMVKVFEDLLYNIY